MWTYIHTDELYHHGVKGQKWGVRRYQSKDGSLTPAGKKHYNQSTQDKQKMSTKKKVAIGVGVAAGTAAVATGAYFVYNYKNKYGSKVIKQGSELQHIAKKFVEDMDRDMYVTHLKSDNNLYRTKFADLEGGKFVKSLSTNTDIKIPSRKVAEKTFKELAESNPAFKEKYGDVSSMSKKMLRKTYNAFNQEFNSPDMRTIQLKSDYFSALSKKGYNAVRDTFDQRAFNATSPVILFKAKDAVRVSKVDELFK